MDAETTVVNPVRKRRNWWKYAFFVMLFLFEGAREVVVLESDTKAKPNVQELQWVFGPAGFRIINAEGMWQRVDGGEKLAPSTVHIECNEERKECLEVTASMIGDSVFVPDLMRFHATFAPDVVSYENDFPACAKYQVRVDLRLKKVFAVREKKVVPKNQAALCNTLLEDRIAMQLAASGYEQPSLNGHFVPLFSALVYVSKLF